MNVTRVELGEFNNIAEQIHLAVFNEVRPLVKNTFDFAVVVFEENRILGYSTIIEMDHETAYMQHGGAVPDIKGTPSSRKAYRAIMDWVRARYKRISTQIQNTNIPMLKFALSEGFLINGVLSYNDGEVFLQLIQGF